MPSLDYGNTHLQMHHRCSSVTPAHEFCASESATNRRNLAPVKSATQCHPAKNGFPDRAKAGTIAPFFIKAPVLGKTLLRTSWRQSTAAMRQTVPPATRAPRDPVGRRCAAMLAWRSPGRPPTAGNAPEHMRTANGSGHARAGNPQPAQTLWRAGNSQGHLADRARR